MTMMRLIDRIYFHIGVLKDFMTADLKRSPPMENPPFCTVPDSLEIRVVQNDG